MKLDDSIRFMDFIIKDVHWSGALDGEKIKDGLEEVLRQLKLAKAGITKREIVALENLIEEKKKYIKEGKY